jgi:hypothetical protein
VGTVTSTELAYRRRSVPVEWRPSTAVGRLLDFEANCYTTALRWYVFAVDVVPILVKYQAKQLWREVGYVVDDFLDALS